MAKIYSAPKGIKSVDAFDYFIDGEFNRNAYEEAQVKYKDDLKRELNSLGYNDTLTGEVVSFPVADGYALYMVMNEAPLKLVHLEISDSYRFEYEKKLTLSHIKERIESEKKLAELFGK